MQDRQRYYRNAVTAGATHLDLLLATYDAVAEDLRLAGHAAQSGNIAARCRHSDHALALLGHLESWLTLLHEPALEASLASFYVFLRSHLLQLQSATSAEPFAELAMQVGDMRAAWLTRRDRGNAAATATAVHAAIDTTGDSRMSWSA